LVDDDIEFEILHRGIQILLDRWLQAVDFIDEKDSTSFDVCEESCEVACLLDHRSAGGADFGIHGIAYDVGECGFAESRRAAEQDVLERIAALLGRLDHDLQALHGFFLTRKFLEKRWPEGNLKSRI
jgi:hypothetical protein